MCGIAGFAAHRPTGRRDWLITGRDSMSHRGPDDAGLWWSPDGRVGLAHRRLAIVDLSSGGHQPMHSATAHLSIVFNGEIYNFRDLRQQLQSCGHQFRTNSDTEVILAAYSQWGIDALSRLNGMFAFALFDSRQARLLLARDRAGEKPLFYSHIGGELRFASEVKGLLADAVFPRRINAAAFDTYLSVGYVPGHACLVENVAKLPPAHVLLFDIEKNSVEMRRYWQLPPPPSAARAEVVQDDNLLDEFDKLLEDAVHRQLEADVPVGVLLSGGVDSSLIAAMAVRNRARVKTFTVGFPGFSKYDETQHARLIARHLDTEHVELKADNISPGLLPGLALQYDEPVVDSSMIPTYLLSRLVRQHCTVALGGDGGDELFGGYAHYPRLLWTQERFSWLPRVVGRTVATAARCLMPTGFKGRNWLQSLGCDLRADLPQVAVIFDTAERRQICNLPPGSMSSLSDNMVWRQRTPSAVDLLQRATRMEFENYLPEDILVKIDRASMLNSLELRAPLLDFRIIEFAFGRVPSRLKATISERKILPKRLAARLLPKEFDQQRKQGFVVPLAEWLRGGPWRSFFEEVLLDTQSIFNRRAVMKLLQGQDRGRHNEERLFALMMFELWRREYGMTL